MTLKEYFTIHPELAVAFSGGTDSAYLLYAAQQYASRVSAYYVRSPLQSHQEYTDALRFCKQYGIDLHIIDLDLLANPDIKRNDSNRCFHCKKAMYTALLEETKKDHYPLLVEGTNASDDITKRPGSKALDILGIGWPLRDCNLTKAQIREASTDLGLFTANKPDGSCLATRIEMNQSLTPALLNHVEQCEDYLYQLGFQDFRVRVQHDAAIIQVPTVQFEHLLLHRNDIRIAFLSHFSNIYLDLLPRNESIPHQLYRSFKKQKGPTKWKAKQL